MSSQQKKNSFYGGVAILTISTIIIKVIGALYKIPLGAILPDAAYGDFGAAYNIYSFFLTISTAGLPVALSKTVSEANALGRYNQVNRVFRVAFLAFFTMGFLSFLCMSVFAPQVARYAIQNEKAVYCVMALSPAVLCTCCCSAFRGYAQGHMNMMPTAVSQVMENVSKLLIGMGLALFIGSMALQPQDFGERMMAVGAIAGVSVGSILSVIYLFFNHRRANRLRSGPFTDRAESSKTILVKLLKLAIPITISSSTMAIVTLIDTNLVNGQLQSVFQNIMDSAPTMTEASQGLFNIFNKSVALLNANVQAAVTDHGVQPVLDSARALYGTYQKCMSIYNLPFSLMVPLTASIIPAVSAARARHNHLEAKHISESALRFSALIALPAGFGLFALGEPIMWLLTMGSTDHTIAGPLLSILGLASIFVCVQLIATSILQANGIVNLPIVTVVIGGIVKIVVNYALVGNPNIMVYGAPVGTLCCFVVVACLNLLLIKRLIPSAPSYIKAFAKPALAAAVMGAAAWAVYGLLAGVLGGMTRFQTLSTATGGAELSFLGNAIAAFGAICVGMVVYFVLVLAFRVISKEDLALMPKGDKIAKFLHIR